MSTTAHAHVHPHAHDKSPTVKSVIVGLAFSIPVAVLMYYFPDSTLDLAALTLAVSAGVYFGFAVQGDVRSRIAVETLANFGFIVLAALGLWWGPIWLVIGYVLHAVWDAFHHFRLLKPDVRRYWPPFCATFDVAVAAIILFMS